MSQEKSQNPTIGTLADPVRIVRGTYAYKAGVSGTVVIPVGARVMSWSTFSSAGGTVTIDGGDSITVPVSGSIAGEAFETLAAATFIFTGTTSYFIEFVT